MDNFLSGRENLGEAPKKSKDASKSAVRGMEPLEGDKDSDSCLVEESEGESGSHVSYVTEEGRVTKIVVTCACGQVTEIDCNYEAKSGFEG